MVTFHISPKTKRPGRCTAAPGKCPFNKPGERPTPHFETQDDALAFLALKALQENEGVIPASRRRTLTARQEALDPDERARQESLLRTEGFTSPPGEPGEILDSLETFPRFSSDPEIRRQEEEAFSQEPSAVSCDTCGAPFSKGETKNSDAMQCKSCGVEVGAIEATLTPREDFADILQDPERVKARRWFHGTWVPEDEWKKYIKRPGAVVHLGSPDAAAERLLANDVEGSKRVDAEGVRTIFEMALQEDAQVSHTIEEDLETENYMDQASHRGHDVVIYANAYEAPGTFSLEARPSSFRIVKVHKVLMKDLRDLRVPMNLP